MLVVDYAILRSALAHRPERLPLAPCEAHRCRPRVVDTESSVAERRNEHLVSGSSGRQFEFCQEIVLVEIHHLFENVLLLVALRALLAVLGSCLRLVFEL